MRVRWTSAALAAVLLVLATLGSTAAPAAAHARLLSSEPGGGSTVTQPPGSIRLVFDQQIEASFGGVQVFDPDGVRVPERSAATITATTVEVAIDEIERIGTYTVAFRVISADGHPIESRYSFLFEPDAVPTTAATGPAAGVPTTPPAPRASPLQIELEDAGAGTAVGLWAARLLNYLSLTLTVGLLLAATVLLPSGHASRPRAVGGAVLAAASWSVTGLALFAFGLSNAAARPLPDAFSWVLATQFAETRFGGLVLAQAGVAAGVAAAAAVGRRRPGAARGALASAALGAIAPALWGHARTDQLPAVAVANDWLHVLGVTAWVGGLAALVLLLLRRRMRAPIAEAAGRFSTMAGWAVVLVAATGVVNTLVHLGRVAHLTGTSWGRLALVKAALLSGVALLGYVSRTRLLPALRDEAPGGTTAPFARLAAVELLFMVGAFGVATQMASAVPADAEAASRVRSFATPFGGGQVNLTVDPSRVGANVMHLYVFDDDGLVDRDARDATITLEQGARVLEPRLLVSGPGHWSVLGQHLPSRGEWIVRVTATTSSGTTSATGAITVG